MGSTGRFLLGAVLFSPKLAFEDTLRYFDIEVPKKSILQIWNESASGDKESADNSVEVNIEAKSNINGKREQSHASIVIQEGS